MATKDGLSILLSVLLLVLCSGSAGADDLLGLYLGGSVGFAHDRDTAVGPCCGHFTFTQSAPGWTAFAGVRPLSYLSVEADYIDFGHIHGGSASGFIGTFDEHTHQNAEALFALGHVPLTNTLVDVYGKLGIARLRTEGQVTYGPYGCPVGPVLDGGAICEPETFGTAKTNADVAYGVGLQRPFGPLFVRAEYVRINEHGGNPDLLSLGVFWRL